MKKAILFSLTLVLLVGPVVAAYSETTYSQPYFGSRETPSGEAVVIDAGLVRPIGIIGMACGLVMTVIALPFSLPSGSASTVYQTLIKEPYDFTFSRPIGYYGPPMRPAGDMQE